MMRLLTSKLVRLRAACALACVLAPGVTSAHAAEDSPEDPVEVKKAVVKVDGMGYFQNRSLREGLKVLEPEEKPLPVLDAAFVEDAVLVLQSALERQGYLRPSGVVHWRSHDGTDTVAAWEPGELPTVPRNLAANRAVFELDRGVRYRYATLEFTGLESIPSDHARTYFIEEGLLLGGSNSRRFTPTGLKQGMENLREQLRRQGRSDATVELISEVRDDKSGAVDVSIHVVEGPLHVVASIDTGGGVPEAARAAILSRAEATQGATYSSLWKQDFLQAVRAEIFRVGHPSAEVRVDDVVEPTEDNVTGHALTLEVDAGPLVHVGDVYFTGDDRTRPSVLRRATRVRTGDVFDRSRVEADRLRLSGLGAFSAVRSDVSEQTPEVWDLEYQLRPGKRLEVGLLAGYGSYEELRGGLQLFHGNQFRRAERGRLQVIESTKSSLAEYQLIVPQLFGTITDASVRAYGLDREEVSFDRREYGVSAGLRRRIERMGFDVALRYQFESLRADNVVADLEGEAPRDSRVAAIKLDLTQDRRDNPLTPRRGYELGLVLETAARGLGGEVDYQRLDFKASWHKRIGNGLHLHLGLRHGLLWSLGGASDEIPLAKRFYPGGESTLRGYREGRAAPRGEEGEVIGAETSTILNIELEQGLLNSLSAVVFIDSGVTAAEIARYPGEQLRVSAGLGLRYNSVIGPARLEYGHNLVRETGDQVGEVHFALGFPF